MKRAVIYARYSSSSQREESIEGQIRVCTDYAKTKDIQIIDTYIDRAISGRTDNRPDFQRLIADSNKKIFDAVIVYKTDRFARNKYDSAIYKAQLKKNNIEIHYAAETIPDGPEGIILESLMEGLAEYYSAELSQKIQRGMYENALKTRATGATPFGYQIAADHTYELDPTAAPLVNKIFEMYISKKPLKAITDYLNELGVKTTTGNAFNKNSLKTILSNPRYYGIYKYTDVIVEGGMPAIISREVFDMAQKETAARQQIKRVSKTVYRLSGKVFCGECKSGMVGVSGTSCTGAKYCYYACKNNRAKSGCNRTKVSKDWLEDFVVRAAIDYILGKIDYIAQKCYEIQTRGANTSHLKQRLADTKKSIRNIQTAIESGGYIRSMSDRLRELENEQEGLEYEIARTATLVLTKEQIAYMLQRFTDPGEDIEKYKTKIIDGFVRAVYVYNTKVLIVYNVSGPGGGVDEEELELLENSSTDDKNAPPYKNANLIHMYRN